VSTPYLEHYTLPFLENRTSLCVSNIEPSLSKEERASLSPKDQLVKILDYAKANGLLENVVKVGLLVTDLSKFLEMNAEYVKYFGAKPPVRVCVQIPGDEVIVFL